MKDDKNKDAITFDLNKHTARLLMSEPFFASLSRRINKTSSRDIPTAGVRINPNSGQFELVYNPDFFEKLSDTHCLGVLKHEFYHLVFEHVAGRMPPENELTMWNYATDLAINSHLSGELPDSCLLPGRGNFVEYPIGLSAEAYMERLKNDEQFQENQQDNGAQNTEDSQGGQSQDGCQQQFDDHKGWGEVSDAVKEIARERLKESIKKAAAEASKANSWGSIPSSCRREIISRLKTHIDWKKVLRYFIKTSQKSSKRSTVRKINKRFPYIHPGKKLKRQAKIAISIDQSGSVSDDMLAAFFGELNKLSKLASFVVIPFDTRVDESLVYEWKKGEVKQSKRVMSGGTDFDAPTNYVNEKDFDGHLVLTDMMAPKPKASKCQRMWMTTKEHSARPYFNTNERVIAITSGK